MGLHAAFWHRTWEATRAEQLRRTFGLRGDAQVGRLSKGESGKLLMLLALAQRPELLILDEPTDGSWWSSKDILGMRRRVTPNGSRTRSSASRPALVVPTSRTSEDTTTAGFVAAFGVTEAEWARRCLRAERAPPAPKRTGSTRAYAGCSPMCPRSSRNVRGVSTGAPGRLTYGTVR